MLWALPLLPLAAGAALWASAAPWRPRAPEEPPRPGRAAVAAIALGATLATLGLAVWAAVARPEASYGWSTLLTLRVEVDVTAAVMAVTIPSVALPILLWAAGHERDRGLARLAGQLVAFLGAMELVAVAGDLLTLIVGWELVGAFSWALIAHHWWERDTVGAASQALVVTRAADLGLVVAAGAALAGTGSLAYAQLPALDGAWLHAAVAGIVVAALGKSAQVPFSPWLFSAMKGPTPVSALLHAATMVAAGVFVLARLHPFLDTASWFGPVVIGVGLATALAAGVVASVQEEAKKLLAGSTSAQYGLMAVAVGAGFPAVAMAHLVAHAGFKALLFLSTGSAMGAAGTGRLAGLGMGRRLPGLAASAAVGALALAAVPPLGAAWTKEHVAAAAGHASVWIVVGVVMAGGLSAFYAARLHLLAFGASGPAPDRPLVEPPGRPERSAAGLLAGATLGVSVVWWPGASDLVGDLVGGAIPSPGAAERAASLALVAAGLAAAWAADRRSRLASPAPPLAAVHDWLALPTLTRRAVADPTLALSRGLARFDRQVVDAGVRGVAALGRAASGAAASWDGRVVDAGVRGVAALGRAASRVLSRSGEWTADGLVRGVAATVLAAGRAIRHTHTGLAHHYLGVVTLGAAALVLAVLWR